MIYNDTLPREQFYHIENYSRFDLPAPAFLRSKSPTYGRATNLVRQFGLQFKNQTHVS